MNSYLLRFKIYCDDFEISCRCFVEAESEDNAKNRFLERFQGNLSKLNVLFHDVVEVT